MQTKIRLFFIFCMGLQSILCFAAQSLDLCEKVIITRNIPTLYERAEIQFVLNLKKMIENDVEESDHFFQKYYSMMNSVHRIEVANAINKDIYALDGELLVERGQLLIHAAMNNKSHIVSLLLMAGADVNIQSSEGYTVLHHAVEKNMIELTALLLQQPAIDLNIKKQQRGDTPLHIAARKDLSGKIVAMLLQAGAYYNSNSGGFTPVGYAIHYKNIKAAKLLIAVGVNVNIGNGSLLDYCTKYEAYNDNKLEVADILLKAGIIVDRVTKSDSDYIDMTPLKYAVIRNDHEMVALLARYGADVNTVIQYKYAENSTQSLLFFAIYEEYTEMVKVLLKAGVVVDSIKISDQFIIDSCGSYLISDANKREEIITSLALYGAEIVEIK